MFKPEERQIYKFHDGTKERVCDPMAAMHALLDACDINAELAVYNALSPRGDELNHKEQKDLLGAVDKIAKATRKAFKLKTLTMRGDKVTGVSNSEAFALCEDFLIWLDDIKKKANT